PIGNVATVTGIATVIRDKNSYPLKIRDDIYLNDVVRTSSNSSLGITFNDATTFNLSASATITIDNYVYEDGGKQNSAIVDSGTRLGALTQGASGFAIRPGTGGAGGMRFAAVPITIPPQQIARDRGFVSQVHLAQTTGRQIVTEQHDFRRANPGASSRIPRPL